MILDWFNNIIFLEEYFYIVLVYKLYIYEEFLFNVIVEMIIGSKIIRNGSN